jgi:hypothetical protein
MITAKRARELLEKATPGEWEPRTRHESGHRTESWSVVWTGENDPIMVPTPRHVADAALIAAAPDLARAVIAQAERMERLERIICQRCDEIERLTRDRASLVAERNEAYDEILRLKPMLDYARREAECANSEVERLRGERDEALALREALAALEVKP